MFYIQQALQGLFCCINEFLVNILTYISIAGRMQQTCFATACRICPAKVIFVEICQEPNRLCVLSIEVNQIDLSHCLQSQRAQSGFDCIMYQQQGYSFCIYKMHLEFNFLFDIQLNTYHTFGLSSKHFDQMHYTYRCRLIYTNLQSPLNLDLF